MCVCAAESRRVCAVLLLSLSLANTTHLGQGRTAAGVVHDFGHHALDVVVALRGIQHTQLGRAHAVLGVGGEHGPTALTLSPDHATHL